MKLNEHQEQYVSTVIEGSCDPMSVIEQLESTTDAAYLNKSFRSLLFALDACGKLGGGAWEALFRGGLTDFADWMDGTRLRPSAFTEIGQHHKNFGYGVAGVALVIDLYERAELRPNNARSFVRRTIREYFNGIKPVDEKGLFHVRRYFDGETSLDDEDFSLLCHINRETRGLDNSPRFPRFYATSIWRCLSAGDDAGARRTSVIIHELATAKDVEESDKLCIRWLKDHGIDLPTSVLDNIDLSMDRLLGIA